MPDECAPPLELLSVIEPEQILAKDTEIILEPSWSDGLQAKFAAHTLSRAAANFLLRDVVLDPQTGIIFQNGAVLDWANYPTRPGEEAAARARAACATEVAPEALAYCGFNREWRNHYHWLTQMLAAIAGYAATSGWQDGMLLLPPIHGAQQRSLDLMGATLPQVVTLDPMRAHAVKRLVFSSLLGHRYVPSPACRAVYERMVKGATGAAQTHAAIYVSRADSANRPMQNESALIASMRSRGIVPLVLSELSLDEQIYVFRNARLIVGPHGAGLSNIVFCRPGAVLFELFPDHWVTPDLKVLAQQQGLHYWAQVHNAHGTFQDFRHRVPWSVDIARIERRLDDIMQRYALSALAA